MPLYGQLADLGVQLLDLPLADFLSISPDTRVERPRRLLLKLFLPGVNLVRMHLVSLGQVRNTPLLSQRLQGDLCLQHRIDLPSCLLHHPLRLARRNGSRSNYPAGPKSRVHFSPSAAPVRRKGVWRLSSGLPALLER